MGGQPIRSLKILNIKYSNSRKEKNRNIFIKNKKMLMVMRYYKGYILSDDVKIIYRYLLREMSELVIYYL